MKKQHFDHKKGNCRVCAELCYGRDLFFRDFPLAAMTTMTFLIAVGFILGVVIGYFVHKGV